VNRIRLLISRTLVEGKDSASRTQKQEKSRFSCLVEALPVPKNLTLRREDAKIYISIRIFSGEQVEGLHKASGLDLR
jgi:hypothetical protein